jgi:dolichol-phosphate mannosyltransferase
MAASDRPISIIVPTYNERDNLAPLAKRIFATVDPREAELLIVDDDSSSTPSGAWYAVMSAAWRPP